MAKQEKIRSRIRTFLPGADETLVDLLVTKVQQDLDQHPRVNTSRLRATNAIIQRVIKQEELFELRLR